MYRKTQQRRWRHLLPSVSNPRLKHQQPASIASVIYVIYIYIFYIGFIEIAFCAITSSEQVKVFHKEDSWMITAYSLFRDMERT